MQEKLIFLLCSDAGLMVRSSTREYSWNHFVKRWTDFSTPPKDWTRGCAACRQISHLGAKLQGIRGLPNFAKVPE